MQNVVVSFATLDKQMCCRAWQTLYWRTHVCPFACLEQCNTTRRIRTDTVRTCTKHDRILSDLRLFTDTFSRSPFTHSLFVSFDDLDKLEISIAECNVQHGIEWMKPCEALSHKQCEEHRWKNRNHLTPSKAAGQMRNVWMRIAAKKGKLNGS